MVRTLAASLLAAAALLIAVGSAGAHTARPGPATSAQPRPATSAQPSAPLPAAIPSGETLRAAGPVAPLPLVLLMGAVVVAGCASRRRLAVALALITAGRRGHAPGPPPHRSGAGRPARARVRRFALAGRSDRWRARRRHAGRRARTPRHRRTDRRRRGRLASRSRSRAAVHLRRLNVRVAPNVIRPS